MSGRIIGISGPTVTVDVPGLKLYEHVVVGERRLLGEVVRLGRGRAVVQVYEPTRGLSIREPAEATGRELTVRLGPGLLSHMFDGLQRPLQLLRERQGPFITSGVAPAAAATGTIRFTPLKTTGEIVAAGQALGWVDEGPFRHLVFASNGDGPIDSIADGVVDPTVPLARLRNGHESYLFHHWPVRVPRPFKRKLAAVEPLVTGQRCIDLLFPLVRGGTAIFPGGFGTGKTILEQAIAKFAAVDIVIYVGCGERGNEMAEMLEEFSSIEDPWSKRPLMARTIVVVNTSNMPVAAREASIYTAVTMAEYYRDMGYHVLLLADSLSRWSEALREISSALEEMPGEEGYPTHLGSRLADYFARAGVVETLDGRTGSVTLLLSVSPPGGDFTEPVTQACLRTTGAFLMLDTALAHRRHFPAINWSQSFSLYQSAAAAFFDEQVSPQWSALRQQAQTLLQQEETLREVAEIVGTEGLQEADRLLMLAAQELRERFLQQNAYTDDAFSSPAATFERVSTILQRFADAHQRLQKVEHAP